MSRSKHEEASSVEAMGIEVPPQRQLAPIEPVLESLSDLASRRDCLRMLAERATAEADKLDAELSRSVASHERALRSLAEQIKSVGR